MQQYVSQTIKNEYAAIAIWTTKTVVVRVFDYSHVTWQIWNADLSEVSAFVGKMECQLIAVLVTMHPGEGHLWMGIE